MKIEYSPDINLVCPSCGHKSVKMSRIFGLYCMGCREWYRNKQSGMIRLR